MLKLATLALPDRRTVHAWFCLTVFPKSDEHPLQITLGHSCGQIWNLFNRSMDDLKKTKWVGDQPDASPDTVSNYVEASSAAIQDMYNIITPLIDRNLPSDVQVDSWFMQTQAENASTDFPVRSNNK